MKIESFDFKKTNSVFLVAELSANHNGSLDNAKETIRAAKRAGADAIKLQTYTADTLTIDCQHSDFIINSESAWDGNTFYGLYQSAFTPWDWHEELFKTAKEIGLICFSSPFDKSAVDFLEALDTPAYKIASFEITDIDLIRYAASKGRPMILSTGVASLDDIELALDACKSVNNNEIALLKCTSSYPAPIEEANISMISDFGKRFNVIPGLSDHTLGSTVPIVATAFGARIVEKHFKLNDSIGGPDSSFSMTELEFEQMVKSVREAEKAIGSIDYTLTKKQLKNQSFKRSLYVVQDIQEGEIITEMNVRSIRPGFGLHPKYLSDILGKPCLVNLKKGDRFSLSYIQ